MNFDTRLLNAGQRITKRYTGMCVCSSIDDYRTCTVCSSSMDAVDQCSFVVWLVRIETEAKIVTLLLGFAVDVRERFCPVPVRHR